MKISMNQFNPVQPTGGLQQPVSTAASPAVGVSNTLGGPMFINGMAQPPVQTPQREFNADLTKSSLLELFAGAIKSKKVEDSAFNLQNRIRSNNVTINDVAAVFKDAVDYKLTTLAEVNGAKFDELVDVIRDTPINRSTYVNGVYGQPQVGSRYVVDNNGKINSMLTSFLKYLRDNGISNVSTLGKFNKLVTAMINESKNKTFSELIKEVKSAELFNKFQQMMKGV